MGASDTTVVTARVSAELKAKLDALARSTNRSKSYLATEAIAAYVEQNAWQIEEIEAGIAELDRGDILSDREIDALYERLSQPK